MLELETKSRNNNTQEIVKRGSQYKSTLNSSSSRARSTFFTKHPVNYGANRISLIPLIKIGK